jgi:hypothetical protein
MYFAGGFCQYKFKYAINYVFKKLYENREASGDIHPYLNNTIFNAANRLFGCNDDPRLYKRSAFIISQFAASQIGIKLGPEKFAAIVHNLRLNHNPVMNR